LQQNNISRQIFEIEQKETIKIPIKVQEALRKFRALWKQLIIVWLSPLQNYVIITEKGINCWSGIGQSTYYNTEHFLFHVEIANSIYSCEGRLKKETKEQWIKYAIESEKQYGI